MIYKYDVPEPNGKCLVARIKIKQNYNEEWYKK